MTLDEAIIHAKEEACKHEVLNPQCAIEHNQLAEWLKELKDYKKMKMTGRCE